MKAAEHDVHAALDKDPSHVEAAILAASLAMRSGNGADAAELLNKAIGYHPKHSGLRAVLASVYAQQGKVDDGAAQLEKIIALEPQTVSHRLRLAQYYMANKRPDDAERVLHEALRQQPKQQELQLALVKFLVSQGKQDQAVTTLEQYINDSPDVYALRFQLAALHQAMGKGDEAQAVYESIIAAAGAEPDGLKARTQLARLLISQGRNERATDLLAQVLKENPRDNDALTLRATLALAHQDAAAAIADLRAVLRDQPTSVPVLRELAHAHVLNGEPDLAIEAMQKAAQAAPQDSSVRVDLAALLADEGQKDKAGEQLEAVLKGDPKQLQALDTLFKLRIAERGYAQAEKLAERIRGLQPGRGEYYAGLVLQAQKKFDDAIARFEAALNKAPGAAEPLSALIKSRLAQGKAGLAERRLRRELKRDDNNVIAYNLLGEVLLFEKKTDAAISALRKAEQINPQLATPYRNLAAAYMAKGDGAAAVAILQKGITATNHEANLVFTLAAYDENRGRHDQAIALYEQALQARPREVMFINNLAMLLANYRHDKKNLDRAVELGERLKERGNPAYLDTLGWAYYRHGDVTAAIPLLEEAARKVSNSALLSYHLGMAYYQKGDHESARRYLEKAVAAKSPYHGVEEAKATLAKLTAS
jgi:tetratricopeptide (TPR) repeat protein